MISIDTNVLLYALVPSAPRHVPAAAFLASLSERGDVALSELVLVELYLLLRNPKVVTRPLAASGAAELVAHLRAHPRWQVLDHDPSVMGDVWRRASAIEARRRLIDLRLGLGLRAQGVEEFATANTRDFEDVGFGRLWDPTAPSA